MKFSGMVTLYNTIEVDFKKKLVPRLLTGVHVEKTRGAEKAAEGDKNTDDLLLIVPFSGHNDVSFVVGDLVAVGDTMLQSQRQKRGMDAAQLSVGGDTGAADSFAELTARAEAEAAPRMFRITSVKTFDFGGLKHWEVIAK